MKSPSEIPSETLTETQSSMPEARPSLYQPGGLSRELTRVVLLIFALVSLWQLSHQLVEILLMFAMVFLLAVILNSVVVSLEKRGVRRGLAVGLIMLCFIGGVALGGWLIVPPALKQANQLVAKAPTYWKTIRSRIGEMEKSYPALKGLVPEFGDSSNDSASSQQNTIQQSVQKSATDTENNATADNADAIDESQLGNAASSDTETSEAPVPPDITDENRATPSEGAETSSNDEDTKKTVTRQVITKSVNRSPVVAQGNQEENPMAPLSGLLQQDAILGYAKRAVAITATLAGAIFVTVLSFLLLLFTLSNPHALVGGILAVAPDEHREATRRSLGRIFVQMTGWARATLINGTITGVLTGVGMAMVGVQPALVFGICAFFGEFVPNVGPLVAAIPAIFVAISMGPTKAAMALGVIVFVQAIASNALNPIIMGREMKLHPVSITFFALAMGKLFGVAGAILAVPTAAVSKILIEEFYLRPRGVNEATIEEQARGIVMNEAGIEDV